MGFDLAMGFLHCGYVTRKPAVILIVGVNGGGKTTSIGKTE